MGFTERALEEQRFLREKYPKLWKNYYQDMMGTLCIPESDFKNDSVVRKEVFGLIGESNKHSRYVLFRDMIGDEEGNLIPGYIVCSADFVE